jgi:hypothetical protein
VRAGRMTSKDRTAIAAVEKLTSNVMRGSLTAVREADLFEMLSEAEYADLKQSILAGKKINAPIHIAEDGAIVDGRNRAKVLHDLGLSGVVASAVPGHYDAICGKARIAVEIVVVAKADIASTVFADNILRRHLTPAERAKLVLAFTSQPGRRAKGSGGPAPMTIRHAAAVAQVSASTLKRARKEANQGQPKTGALERSPAERVAEMHQRLLLAAERNMPLLGASRAEARAAAVRLAETLGKE